jgi:hypothetical protein
MKKIVIIISTIFFLVAGNYVIFKAIQEIKFLLEEKPRIEKYLKYNYENIENITLTKIVVTPKEITHIEGYVNNRKDMKFDAIVYDKHFEKTLRSTGKKTLTRNYKALENGEKSVSEIEKEEMKQ